MAANYLLAVFAEVDPEIEEAWNEWYNTKHVPDILACPGLNANARYVETGPDGKRCYVAIYEIDGLDVMETPEFTAARGWEHFTGRVKSHFKLYEKVFEASA